MLSLRIAVRFLLKSPIQTVLIVAGIAVGIAVQIFVGSLIASLQSFLIDQTLGSSPHLTLTAKAKGEFIDYNQALRIKLKKNAVVKAVVPQRTVSAIFVKGSQSAPLSIKCADATKLDSIYKLKSKLKGGDYSLGDNEIIVGSDFASGQNVRPGDMIKLTLASRAVKELRVSSIVDLGNKQANETVAFAGTGFGRAALGASVNRYSAVEIQLSQVFQSTAIAKNLAGAFPDITITDWQIEQKSLLSGLQAQSSSTFMIQFFVLIAVALGIASTLSISAIQKTRQIGILKALGMTDGRSGTIFLWQGLFLGFLGSLGGLLLGLGLIAIFSVTAGAKPGSFPITPQTTFVIVSVGIGLAVAMLSAILPSRRTARLDPIEVIQSGG